MAITETEIRRLATPSAGTKLMPCGHGLYLKLYHSGRRTWLHRSRPGGKWRVISLGHWPAMSLAAARSRALELSDRGIPDAMTFGQLLDKWFAKRIEPHYVTTKNTEIYVNLGKRELGNVQLARLSTPMLVSALQTYAERAPVAANRCLGAWKLCLDYGVELGTATENVLRRTTTRAVGGNEPPRDRVLTDAEIRLLWSERKLALCRFLLATSLRISEAQTGRQEGDRWVMDTTKNKKPHWVHLPPMVKAIAEGYEFSTSNTAAQSQLKRWCAKHKIDPAFTPHDLRRTAATRMAGLGIEPYIVEKVLNHSLQGVMAIYNRHDYAHERVNAAELWAKELKRIVEEI